MVKPKRLSGVAQLVVAQAQLDESKQSTDEFDLSAPSTAPPMFMGAVYPRKGLGSVPPESCRPWALADRPDSEFEHLEALADSLLKDGQLQPAVVRPVQDPAQPHIRYEIIAGQARWRAAKQAGLALKVLVNPEMDDEAAFRAMVGENEFRKELSDFSRGKRYAAALERKLYQSKGEMATKLRISNASLSRLLGFAELDSEIVSLIKDLRNIPASVGYELSLAVQNGFRAQVIRDIGRIEAGEIPRNSIPAVWESEAGQGALQASPIFTGENRRGSEIGNSKRQTGKSAPSVHKGEDGRLLFTAKEGGKGAFVIRIPAGRAAKVTEAFLSELEGLIESRLG